MSLLYWLIIQDYSTEIPWEAEKLELEQTADCSERPFTKASHRESNMLSYEDDKAPHQTRLRTKGIFGMLTMLAFHGTGMGFPKVHPLHSPTGPQASMHFHD